MEPIGKAQIQKIYALGAGIGIVESGNKNDDLHALVQELTGKDSVSKLTAAEFETVKTRLIDLMRYRNRPEPLKGRAGTPGKPSSVTAGDSFPQGKPLRDEDIPGMMTRSQQSKAWRFIYRLIELGDGNKMNSGKRMCGAIKAILGVDAAIEKPFAFVSFDDGIKLIDTLKGYVRNEERKAARRVVG